MDREVIRRRQLPHWDVPQATYFVTTCLENSIPAQGLLDVERFRHRLDQELRPSDQTDQSWKVRQWKRAFVRIEDWLDRNPANRLLERADLATLVVQSMWHFAGERYQLLAYVVMPSHIHWLFHPLPEWVSTLKPGRRTPRERIMYSFKRWTANCCHRLMGTWGSFWQSESYDHWVRDVDELVRIVRYIEDNPVKAGLVSEAEQWPDSSAALRKALGIEAGLPLRKQLSGAES